MVRSGVWLAIVIGLVAIGLAAACSGDEPDRGPNDPEALAAAAALTTDDLPDLGWQQNEQTFAEIFATPDPDETPFPLPPDLEACGLFDSLENPPTPMPTLSSAFNRSFFDVGLDRSGANIFTTVSVFETEDAARLAVEEMHDADPFGSLFDEMTEECEQVVADSMAGVDDGSAIIVQRERDPGFQIREAEIAQLKITVSSSAGVDSSVTTLATFVRGHVVARYNASESEDGLLDHEELIRAFVERVTDAQLADRALVED